MNKPEPSPREMARSFTPQLTALVDNPLFSDVWADPTLSPRDRNIRITILRLSPVPVKTD
jgi:hypothetical protein